MPIDAMGVQLLRSAAGFSHIFQKVTLKRGKNHPLGLARSISLLDQEPTLGGGVAGVHGRSTDGVHGWPVLYDSGGQDGLPAVLLIRLH